MKGDFYFPLTYSEVETVGTLLGPDVCSNAPNKDRFSVESLLLASRLLYLKKEGGEGGE